MGGYGDIGGRLGTRRNASQHVLAPLGFSGMVIMAGTWKIEIKGMGAQTGLYVS